MLNVDKLKLSKDEAVVNIEVYYDGCVRSGFIRVFPSDKIEKRVAKLTADFTKRLIKDYKNGGVKLQKN